MTDRFVEESWHRFHRAAEEVGINRLWVLPRETCEQRLPADVSGGRPAALHPGYHRAVLLGLGGRAFWEGFQAAPEAGDPPESDPLDRYSERIIETLCTRVRVDDPSVLAAYPFFHTRQVLGFQRLLGQSGRIVAPFGVVVDPHFGPWSAWRGMVLTELDWPVALPPESPCPDCDAPCEAQCPVGAVHRSGFDWPTCASFRLSEPTCRETCLARLACPVGPGYRYSAEQMAFHHRGSLRRIEAFRAAGRLPMVSV